MLFNQTKFLTSISFALDFIEMDLLKNVSHHNKKVAYISDCLAQKFEFNDADRLDLATCALLHDSGAAVYQYNLKVSRSAMEGPKEHCSHSQLIVDKFPLSQPYPTALLYHHEYADGSGYFGKTQIPLFSQIIAISDTVERLFNLGHGKEGVSTFIERNRGVKFESILADAFLELASHPAFWLDMEPLFISMVLDNQLPKNEIEYSWTEIRLLTQVLSSIIDMKSAFTAHHSSGLSEKTGIASDFYKFDVDHKTKLLIAADLHDLGKLAIPNAILDKPDKLTEYEFAIIKTHTYYTRRALEGLAGFENITNWAANHHETLVGKGYPFGIKNLSFEERLLAVLDIYQALTENRPYRGGMSHIDAVAILKSMASDGKLDKEIVSDVQKIFA